MSGKLNLRDRTVLFVHVPKTAGTSIERLPWVRTGGHNPIWTFPKHMLNNADWSFTVVRHPQDRFMSAATAGLLIEGEPPYGPKEDQLSFGEMKNKITSIIIDLYETSKEKPIQVDRVWKRVARYPAPYPHFVGWPYRVHYLPMWFFLTMPDGTLPFHFIAKYESLAEDWKIICKACGVEHKSLPHHRNASLYRAPLKEYYTPETKEMIATLYKKDFELFGYEPY